MHILCMYMYMCGSVCCKYNLNNIFRMLVQRTIYNGMVITYNKNPMFYNIYLRIYISGKKYSTNPTVNSKHKLPLTYQISPKENKKLHLSRLFCRLLIDSPTYYLRNDRTLSDIKEIHQDYFHFFLEIGQIVSLVSIVEAISESTATNRFPLTPITCGSYCTCVAFI